jgi:beta-fructofuranosidase
MSLRLPNHWLWDFWFAEDGDDVHVFFLHAPRDLGHSDLRHSHARIGHAVSRDLRNWDLLPTALDVGASGAFDDLATWTGSILGNEGHWCMFYSGISTREDGKVQRIGLAVSDDLTQWEKQGMVLEADPRLYETLDGSAGEEAWRDPWVFWDDNSNCFHMLITARANCGPLDGRGVIGHALSSDLRSWEVAPPLSAPGEFRHLEVPQLVYIGATWRVQYSVTSRDHSAARLARPGTVPEVGTHYLLSTNKLGPYALDDGDFLLGYPPGRYYAGRLIRRRDNWFLFAWWNHDEGGRFIGELSNPMPLIVHADGSLSICIPEDGPIQHT